MLIHLLVRQHTYIYYYNAAHGQGYTVSSRTVHSDVLMNSSARGGTSVSSTHGYTSKGKHVDSLVQNRRHEPSFQGPASKVRSLSAVLSVLPFAHTGNPEPRTY